MPENPVFRKHVWEEEEGQPSLGYEVETKFGTMYVAPLDKDRVNITSDGYSVTVNRVKLNLLALFYRRDDGTFGMGEDESGYRHFQALYARREDFADPSWAARRQIPEVLTPIVNEWVRENPHRMAQAEIIARNNKVFSAFGRAAEKKREHDEAIEELREGEKALAAAKELA